jgi:hypothetical protein
MSEEKEPGYFEQMETLLQQYVNDRILLLKLQATEKASRFGSLALIFIVIAGLVFFMLFFISIMAGYFFAELTGSLFYGFSIVTGIYVLLVVLLFLVRKRYLGPFLVNVLIRIFSEKINDQDEEGKSVE